MVYVRVNQYRPMGRREALCEGNLTGRLAFFFGESQMFHEADARLQRICVMGLGWMSAAPSGPCRSNYSDSCVIKAAVERP